MCTAATYKTKDFYFGRNLDYDFSYGDEVTITPRNFELKFREEKSIKNYYAMLEEQEYDGEKLEQALVYSDIGRQPNRKKCALLSWWGMEKILQKLEEEK